MHQNSFDSWLSDVAILNESPRFSEPGDVTVYRNIAEMCSGLEHWFIEEEISHALTGKGLPIELTTDGKSVFGKVMENSEPDTAVLTSWLMSSAASVREARLYKANKRGLKLFGSTHVGPAERDGLLPESVEGLIAYVGFH